MQAIFLSNNPENVKRVYPESVINDIKESVKLHDLPIGSSNLVEHSRITTSTNIAFSTWGMPPLTKEQIKEYLPNLKVLFYGAGSVQAFSRPFLELGIRISSAWSANGVPVAEYATSQIILANKGFYTNSHLYKKDVREARSYSQSFPGNYNVNVGILGAGMIGTMVIKMLKAYMVNVLVFDPFLSDERALELGVTKHSLEEIFARCQTVSNHLANNEHTQGILNKKHFNLMLPNATFINTGRGAQVVEEDLIDALKEVTSRTAVLDVTYPEPVKSDSEFLSMDNVFLTTHIAGSLGNEVERMGSYMADELKRYLKYSELKYEVTMKMLETMA